MVVHMRNASYVCYRNHTRTARLIRRTKSQFLTTRFYFNKYVNKITNDEKGPQLLRVLWLGITGANNIRMFDLTSSRKFKHGFLSADIGIMVECLRIHAVMENEKGILLNG